MRKTTSLPFEIPPLMPPQLFVAVFPSDDTMQSLYSEPSIDAEAIAADMKVQKAMELVKEKAAVTVK